MSEAEFNPYKRTLIRWWQELLARHEPEAFAVAPSSVSDPRVTNHMFSCGFKRGIRHFAFRTVEDRDRFLSDIPEAEACENPHPLQPVAKDATRD